MEKELFEQRTLVCYRCNKQEKHYVFNKFLHGQVTVDLCDQCASELRSMLEINEDKHLTIIKNFMRGIV